MKVPKVTQEEINQLIDDIIVTLNHTKIHPPTDADWHKVVASIHYALFVHVTTSQYNEIQTQPPSSETLSPSSSDLT